MITGHSALVISSDKAAMNNAINGTSRALPLMRSAQSPLGCDPTSGAADTPSALIQEGAVKGYASSCSVANKSSGRDEGPAASSVAGMPPLHISLSRTLSVDFHLIPTLLEALKEGLGAAG